MKYSDLAEVYEELENTTKRLEKTHILSEFLKKTHSDDINEVMLLLQGKVFPSYDERKIGFAARLMIKALNIATGIDNDKIELIWKKTGDLGETAEQIVSRKKQATLFSKSLTASKVFENIKKLAEMQGAGTVDRKVKLVAELLTSASPKEARYIVRTILEDLRIGLGEGTIRDAIVWAYFGDEIGFKYDKKENDFAVEDREKYNSYTQAVQEMYDVTNDFAEVAEKAKKGLKSVQAAELRPGKPIKVMLYLKSKGLADAFETVGKPAALEYKYDGFRLQIHKHGDKIILFTRRLEDVTKQFPDILKFVKEHVKADSYIIDCEAVGYDKETKKYIAFQNISQRIKRKYDIEDIAKKFPVEVNVFDVMFYNGQDLLKTPFAERRKILEKMIKNPVSLQIKPAFQLVTGDMEKAQKFYEKSLDAGNEGIMAKNLEGIYKPGARVGYGVKVKPTMETLDVVIVGGIWGEGKRSSWLASFIIAVYDSRKKEFVEIGRVGTGIKEKEEEGTSFAELTKMMKPLIIEEKGKIVYVKPKIVIEVDYEEIQKSPTYSSGYALRFPRFVRLRPDKSAAEISTLKEAENLYTEQRGRG